MASPLAAPLAYTPTTLFGADIEVGTAAGAAHDIQIQRVFMGREIVSAGLRPTFLELMQA